MKTVSTVPSSTFVALMAEHSCASRNQPPSKTFFCYSFERQMALKIGIKRSAIPLGNFVFFDFRRSSAPD